jgi:hypothetical protein
LDSVSREKKYFTWTETPPFKDVKTLAANNIAGGKLQLMTLDKGKIVAWCDVTSCIAER